MSDSTNDLQPDSRPKESLSPAVNSAGEILDLLAISSQPLTLSEIARQIDRAKSTVSNIVTALEQTRLIERSGQGFQLGRKLVELGGAYLAQTDLVADFHRACRTLPTAKEETLSLSSLQYSEILYLAHHNGSQPVRWFANVGARLPVIHTAMGIAMLSTLEVDDLDSFIQSVEFEAPTEFAYSSAEQLRQAVLQAREDGYAVGDQLNTLGLCSLARPVYNEFDDRRLAVGVTMLSARRSDSLERKLLDDLLTLAEELPPAAR